MKKQNGITLISLIITIIIMLILAGVSLSMVMGDGSMLDQANAAADNTRIAEVQEFVNLAAAGNKMAKYSKIGLKSKATLLTEMNEQGLITDAEKAAVEGGADLEINGTKIEFSELETTYQAAADAGVTEDVGGVSSPVQKLYWNVTLNDAYALGITASTTKVEQGSDETVTLTCSDSEFYRWSVSGNYTIVSGSVTTSTFVIKPTSDIRVSAMAEGNSPV